MRAVAIITARGGSKRIPKKNIKEFFGKPIIAYSIEAALKSEMFDKVMVSTDSQEIAEISRKYGAEVPFMRSEKTSNDFAGTSDVILEVLEEYEKKGQFFDYSTLIIVFVLLAFGLVMIYSTSSYSAAAAYGNSAFYFCTELTFQTFHIMNLISVY